VHMERQGMPRRVAFGWCSAEGAWRVTVVLWSSCTRKVETCWSRFTAQVSNCWDLRLYRRPRGMFFSAADKGHMARAPPALARRASVSPRTQPGKVPSYGSLSCN